MARVTQDLSAETFFFIAFKQDLINLKVYDALMDTDGNINNFRGSGRLASIVNAGKFAMNRLIELKGK